MAFTLSGNIITQSGTDDNFAGLAAISGVIAVTSNGFTIYHMGGLKLNIAGTVTIDPQFEQLLFDTHICISILNGGRLNLGKLSNLSSTSAHLSKTPGTCIISTQDDLAWDAAQFLQVESGGHLEWIGASVRSRCGMRFLPGSTVNITDGIFECNGLSVIAGRENRGNIVFLNSTGITINGWTIIGGAEVLLLSDKVPSISGLIMEAAATAAVINLGPDVLTLRDSDFANRGNGTDIPLSGGNQINVLNSSSGTDLNMTGIETEPQYLNYNRGYIVIQKEIQCEVFDSNGPVEGARIYIRSTNHGHRKNLGGHDDTADKINSLTTAASGITEVATVVTGIVNVVGTNPKGSPNTAPYDVDVLGKTNVLGEDVFDLHVWSYAHNHTLRTVALKGKGALTVQSILVADSSISEPDMSVVLGYTEIDTPQKFYDRYKAYLTNNYNGEASNPVSIEGTTLNAGSLNVTVDGSAAETFSPSADSVTIKAVSFQGSLKTTGTVTLNNGATVTEAIQDAAGDSVMSVTVPAGFDYHISVHYSEHDAENELNTIAEGNVMRYIASELGGQTLFYHLERENGAHIIEMVEIPTGVGVYHKYLITTSTESTLSKIQITSEKLSTMMEASGSNYRFTADAVSQSPSGSGGTIDTSALATTEQLTAAKTEILTEVNQIPTTSPDLSAVATSQQLTSAKDEVIAKVDAIPTDAPDLSAIATTEQLTAAKTEVINAGLEP